HRTGTSRNVHAYCVWIGMHEWLAPGSCAAQRVAFLSTCALRSDDTRSAPQPGRASDRQGASPSWLISASTDGCDQSGKGAPPLDRNGDPDPCLLGSPVGRDKGRNAFRKALRKQTRGSTTGPVALP